MEQNKLPMVMSLQDTLDSWNEKFWQKRYQGDTYVSSPYKDDIEWLTDDAVWYFRVTLLTMNTVLFYYPKMVQINFFRNFVWLTLMAVQFTEYSLLASIYAGKYTYTPGKFNQSDWNQSLFDWKAIANLLNAAALTINFIVTVVSWPLIMPYILMGENYSIWNKID